MAIALAPYFQYAFRPLWYIIGLMGIGKDNPLELDGTWDYSCVLINYPHFPGADGNAHGGEVIIKTKSLPYHTRVYVSGLRKWEGNWENGTLTKNILTRPKKWDSKRGAFIKKDEIMYTYKIGSEPVDGITFLKLIFDKNNNALIPQGQFYYCPEEDETKEESHDSDNMSDPSTPKGINEMNFKNSKKNKTLHKYGGLYGDVTFTYRRKT